MLQNISYKLYLLLENIKIDLPSSVKNRIFLIYYDYFFTELVLFIAVYIAKFEAVLQIWQIIMLLCF